MSQPKAFVPLRLVQARRVAPVAREMDRADFLRWWSALMMRRLGTAHAIARRFDCTEQTGRNWLDGFSCPTGLQVMKAFEWWPEDFAGAAAWMQRGPARRAA
jgi:transposase-like protein